MERQPSLLTRAGADEPETDDEFHMETNDEMWSRVLEEQQEDAVRSWLDECGLPKYKTRFLDEGLDNMRIITNLRCGDIARLAIRFGMKPFHRTAFLRGVAALNTKVRLCVSSTSMAPGCDLLETQNHSGWETSTPRTRWEPDQPKSKCTSSPSQHGNQSEFENSTNDEIENARDLCTAAGAVSEESPHEASAEVSLETECDVPAVDLQLETRQPEQPDLSTAAGAHGYVLPQGMSHLEGQASRGLWPQIDEPQSDDNAIWKVVARGGVTVRIGEALDSGLAEPSRLAHRSIVKQIGTLVGTRLEFALISGRGPQCGWVTTRLRDGTDLLAKRPSTPRNGAEPERNQKKKQKDQSRTRSRT